MLTKFTRLRRQFLYKTAQACVNLLSGRRVMGGPWKAMRYPTNLHGGNAVHAKLLGMYEKELEPVFNSLASVDYTAVIDIGSAEGFYVVGCALRYPNAKVIGFETSEACRRSLHDLAKFNDVIDRISIRGYCDGSSLSAAMRESTGALLVIADAEGAESALLDPELVPELKRATMIVETHDFLVPGESALLAKRFGNTHTIQTISVQSRTAADLPFACPSILQRWFLHVGSDQRSEPETQTWMYFEPRS